MVAPAASLSPASRQQQPRTLRRSYTYILSVYATELVCWPSNVCIHNPKISKMDRLPPSSKSPHFQNEAKCTTFLVKMSFNFRHENENSFPNLELSN